MRHVAQSNLRKLKINRLNFVIPLMAMGGLGAIGILAINQDADYDASATDSVAVDSTVSYGDYYISMVNSASSLELDVDTTASGAYAYATDNVTVRTNATGGYSLYLTSGDSDSAALKLNGTETSTNKVINTSTATGGASGTTAVLAVNTYGYAVPSGQIGNNNFDASYDNPTAGSKWAGIATSTDNGLIRSTSSQNEEGDTVDVHYGVYANNALVAGEYTGTVVYTAVADLPTSVAASISPTSGEPYSTVTVTSGPLVANTATLANSEVSVTIGGSACTVTNVDASNGYLVTTCTVPSVTAGAQDVVISVPRYSYVATISGGYTVNGPPLQTFTTDKCSALTQWKSDGTEGDTIALSDSRDGSGYEVRRLADNHCWMVTNLRLGKTDKEITLHNTDTDITASSWDLPASSNGSGNPSWSDSEDAAYMHVGTDGDCASNGNCWTSIYGNYYNWPAAVAGSVTESGDVTTSICPKGWKLPPHSGTYSWDTLYTSYGSDKNKFKIATNTGSGYWSGNYGPNSLYNIESSGYWWSRTAYNSTSAYGSGTSSSSVSPHYNLGRGNGLSVRCVFVGS